MTAAATDVIESTSVLLKRLDNKDLALEPTQKVPVMRGAAEADKISKPTAGARGPDASAKTTTTVRHPAMRTERKDTGGGFDPYNSR